MNLALELVGAQAIAYDVGAFGGIGSRRKRLYPVSVRTTPLDDLRLEQGEGSGFGWLAVRLQKDFAVHCAMYVW